MSSLHGVDPKALSMRNAQRWRAYGIAASRFVLVIAFVAVIPSSALAQNAERTWSALPSGNGYGFSVFDTAARRLNFFSERPYAERAPGEVTRNLAFDAYFGLRAAGGGAWLGERAVDDGGYEDQTHVVRVSQRYGPLHAQTYAWAPWGHEFPAVVMLLHVTNASRIAQSDTAAYALLNFHLGAGAPQPSANGERIHWNSSARAYQETGPSGLTLTYVPITDPSRHACGANNPYPVGRAGGDLVDTDDSGTMNDAVAGFQWNINRLEPGADVWFGVMITLGPVEQARSYLGAAAPSDLLAREVRDWNAWRAAPPSGLDATETRIWRQSETVLRMAQSREPPPSRGQLPAALPTGIWQITWARDMAYALAALARSGHMTEAGLGVDFLRGGRVGEYRSYVGHEYSISVVRYFGNGLEWSDTNEDGPNVEFDGFGLAVWAARLANRTDLDGAVTPLLRMTDSTGLIVPDSSIWEVHWNGRQKHFTYTSITAANGLCLAGHAAEARALRDAIVRNLVLPTGGLAGNLEELRNGQPARDAAVVEAINWGLIQPRGRLAVDTLLEFERLRTRVGRGYFRNDDGGGYDSHEWVFIDLRIASALRRAGLTQEADELLAWATRQADANFGLHAELLHPETAHYGGAIPMVGFGAGAYMLALLDRTRPEPEHPECFPPESGTLGGSTDAGATGDGGAPAPRGGCHGAPRSTPQDQRAPYGLLLTSLTLCMTVRSSRRPKRSKGECQ